MSTSWSSLITHLYDSSYKFLILRIKYTCLSNHLYINNHFINKNQAITQTNIWMTRLLLCKSSIISDVSWLPHRWNILTTVQTREHSRLVSNYEIYISVNMQRKLTRIRREGKKNLKKNINCFVNEYNLFVLLPENGAITLASGWKKDVGFVFVFSFVLDHHLRILDYVSIFKSGST